MMNQKMKTKPPPLRLHSNVEESCELIDSLSLSDSYLISEEVEDMEKQFEGILIELLDEDELMPFNLHTAASLGITACVRNLIERCDIDVNLKNSGEWTSLMYASLFSHDETVLYLMEMKADVNSKNPCGKTPLMLASLCGSEDTLRLLLQHGASLEERDSNEFTALMLAIQATHSEAAQLLLDYGANPNVQESIHGQCALYIAAQSGQFAMVRALILKGVDVDVKTCSGDSAYHVALRNGYTAISKLITEQQHVETPASTSSQVQILAPLLVPVPSRYRPKSPYSTFFQQYQEIPSQIPEVVIDQVDHVDDSGWKSHEGPRCSPEGVESSLDDFNPFNAWPGTSMMFKQAVSTNRARDHFQKSITKPYVSTCPPSGLLTNTSEVPVTSPWSPTSQECSGLVRNYDSRSSYATSVKLPKDLSSVLANLGLAKYQMHFEEQDIDLQVFLTMNETDLREIGINSFGARRKFLSTIEYFQTRTNYYRISEEFLVNTWVSKNDLANLKVVWDETIRTISELRHHIGNSVLSDQLMKSVMKAEGFFRKY